MSQDVILVFESEINDLNKYLGLGRTICRTPLGPGQQDSEEALAAFSPCKNDHQSVLGQTWLANQS